MNQTLLRKLILDLKFKINLNHISLNQLFHNLLWKYFVETEIHREMSEKYSASKGKNVVFTGYPGLDVFFIDKYRPIDTWKIKDRRIKRVIWAVHHSIHNDKNYFSFSNFMSLHQVMLDIAHEFRNEIQIVFNPHQILKSKLYLEPDWGQEKTNSYFEQWNSLGNGQLNESDYIDLFLTSDAMIVDSVSFLTEYLCVNKPSLYMMRVKNQIDTFNEYGKKIAAFHYNGSNEQDIRNFLSTIVFKGNDTLKDEREKFVKSYLTPAKGNSASENIYLHLKNQVKYP